MAKALTRWRKASDVGREHALFELLVGEEAVMDLGYSDEGVLELAFHAAARGWIVAWPEFETLVAEGRRLADEDR